MQILFPCDLIGNLMALQYDAAMGRLAPRVPKRTWVGLIAVVVVVAINVGLGNLLAIGIPGADVTLKFAVSHFIPLPITIIVALLFLRWARWGRDVWAETPTLKLRPARRWLIAIPALLTMSAVLQVAEIPWADRTALFVLVIVVGTALVGFNEELYVRGILLTAARGRHGELYALTISAGVFAIAHLPISLINGFPAYAIGLQIGALLVGGVGCYWVRRVTGRLWAAIAVHALTDCVLYLGSDFTDSPNHHRSPVDLDILGVPVEVALWVMCVISIVSVAREDRRRRDSQHHELSL
ncbi:hypothetical protein DEI98_06815 [Curtobacterium sp. MCLR17_034]|nr:hypothetical protein DEI98_06815 [Curtobacterium sp. MCLR17_034]